MTTDVPPDEPTAASDDDGEDAMLDRLDAGLPAASAEEAAARAPYERLLARVRDRPMVAAPAGMEERAQAAWEAQRATERAAERARRRRGMAVGALGLAAAAVIVFVVMRGGSPGKPSRETQIAYVASDGITRGDKSVGSTVRVTVGKFAAHVELRIYRRLVLVARCPGSEGCTVTSAGLRLDWTLHESGTYRVVTLSGKSEIPAPDPNGYDTDSILARRAGIVFDLKEKFEVMP